MGLAERLAYRPPKPVSRKNQEIVRHLKALFDANDEARCTHALPLAVRRWDQAAASPGRRPACRAPPAAAPPA